MRSFFSGGARTRLAALAVVAGQAVAFAGASSAQVQWRTGADGHPKMAPARLVDATMNLANRANDSRVLVQFDAPLSDEHKRKLGLAGLRLLNYVGDNAYFATIERESINAAALATQTPLRSIGAIETEWKLHPVFAEQRTPTWAVVPRDDKSLVELDRTNPYVGAYVLFHPDSPIGPAAKRLVEEHGARVRDSIRSVNGFVIEIPQQNVGALAAEDDIQYIEPAMPRMSELNAQNRVITDVDIVQTAPYNLDGTGVTVLVYDGGFGFSAHADFSGRHTVRDSSGLSDHATHVAGTVGGDGSNNPAHTGMAPNVIIESYGFDYDGSGIFLYSNPGDIEDDYDEAINTYGADISNNSIGTNTAPNGFPCDITGDYGVTSQLIDTIISGSLGAPIRVFWANGNERQTTRCGSTYLTTAPPACAKNHITVGALNAEDDSVTDFTSWGPTDDGRLKPDISGPGCQDVGDFGVTSASSSGGYSVKCGTSMSSPTAAGIGALILQDWRAQFPSADDPRNSTMKALLAHTAVDIQNPGPDYQTGYGSIRAQAAIDEMRTENWVENEVSQSDVYSLLVVVGAGDPQMKVTLAWDDVAGQPNVSPSLVNDLDLEVFDPMGVQHFPWTLDPANPANPAVQTQADRLNNIEQVCVDAPMSGVWTVNIRGFNVPSGPQPFSVLASPLLVNCSPAGVALLDSGRYACESIAGLRVVDCNLNTDDMLIEQTMVIVTSDSEPGGEIVLLTETGGPTAAFEGSIAISETDAPGTLLVADGDTITMTYIDADDGMGGMSVVVDDMAVVDCTPPVISNVVVDSVEPRSAIITFETDEPASSSLAFGLDCGMLDGTVDTGSLRTMHSVEITGLQDNTTYFFGLSVEDQAGNAGSDPGPGPCYSFTTPEIPDFFTELFEGDHDLDNMMLTLSPNGSFDFYTACIEPIITLPVDPAGGTPVSLSDDDSELVALTGGAMVSLYGVSYPQVYIGSNGYLTFAGSSTDFSETLDEHFSIPRVALLYDDLNPTISGTVSYEQMADRFVVTYDNIAEYSTTNSNTMQVMMFFDGTIVISWLDIDSADSIVGVSAGDGLSPDFFETDLSGVGACGPRPPSAIAQSLGTPENTSVNITLGAVDDGLPDPPAQLEWTITTLPADGVLTDLGGGVISAAPHTLASNGDQVMYTPFPGFQGPDEFMFMVNDGGVAPDGGDSNVAIVTVNVGVPELIYAFNLDSFPGWTLDGGWDFGRPLAGGSHAGDPGAAHTGEFIFGYAIGGDYPNNMSVEYLTTSAIDCSELTEVRLEFRRWLGVESSTFDHAGVDVSSDGSTWVNVWDHSGSAINEGAWSHQVHDISSVADGAATLFVRWYMGTTDGSVTYHGWSLDDIQIWGVAPSEGNSGDGPDLNGDGVVNSTDLATLIGVWGPCPPDPAPCIGDLNGDGTVGSADLAILIGSWS